MAADTAPPHPDPVAAYKALLRGFIDRRPSGLRGRLAQALGKHKSFVTQITSPAYKAPIPAKDLATIFEVCHLAPEERAQFLDAYRLAHPRRLRRDNAPADAPQELKIALPPFGSRATARAVETTILDFATRVIRLAQQAEAQARDGARTDQERTP